MIKNTNTEKTPEVRIQELEKQMKIQKWAIFLLTFNIILGAICSHVDYKHIEVLEDRVDFLSEYELKGLEHISNIYSILESVVKRSC